MGFKFNCLIGGGGSGGGGCGRRRLVFYDIRVLACECVTSWNLEDLSLISSLILELKKSRSILKGKDFDFYDIRCERAVLIFTTVFQGLTLLPIPNLLHPINEFITTQLCTCSL